MIPLEWTAVVKKILIVDDSLMDRKLLKGVLVKSGITQEFLEASDGEIGLQVLSQNYQEICLILLDWQMPKIDGMEFMRAVVKVSQTAAIPIVMITASSSQENKNQAYAINPQLAAYVIKPYKSQDLIAIIQPFLK